MGSNRSAERLLGALHKVATATTVSVNFDTAGNHIRTLSVKYFSTYDFEVSVRDLDDLAVAHKYRAILFPTRRGQNITIDNSCKHSYSFCLSYFSEHKGTHFFAKLDQKRYKKYLSTHNNC